MGEHDVSAKEPAVSAARLRAAYTGGPVAPLRDGSAPTAAGHGPDNRAILVEVGKRKMVGGQEDMIVDIALDMVRARDEAVT